MTFHHSAEPVPSETYPPGQGDLVVLTSDNTSICVYSIILELASPVWQASKDSGYVVVPEDSETFECLLSFIYPDRMPLEFESLDIALSVLRTAHSYKMDRAIQDISRRLFDPSCHTHCVKHLIAAEPLRVYAVAKELKLEQLAKRSGALTLTADIYVPSISQEVEKMNSASLMELIQMRYIRKHWLDGVLREPTMFSVFPVEYQNHQRADGQDLIVPACSCPEGEFNEDGQHRYLPYKLRAYILECPSPIVIEEIDFCKELGCLRCGAAANVYFGAICRSYRETFHD